MKSVEIKHHVEKNIDEGKTACGKEVTQCQFENAKYLAESMYHHGFTTDVKDVDCRLCNEALAKTKPKIVHGWGQNLFSLCGIEMKNYTHGVTYLVDGREHTMSAGEDATCPTCVKEHAAYVKRSTNRLVILNSENHVVLSVPIKSFNVVASKLNYSSSEPKGTVNGGLTKTIDDNHYEEITIRAAKA